eukprot:COSAG05_NODE_4619_length_1435_cov_29.002246_2_plen_135_part_00
MYTDTIKIMMFRAVRLTSVVGISSLASSLNSSLSHIKEKPMEWMAPMMERDHPSQFCQRWHRLGSMSKLWIPSEGGYGSVGRCGSVCGFAVADAVGDADVGANCRRSGPCKCGLVLVLCFFFSTYHTSIVADNS